MVFQLLWLVKAGSISQDSLTFRKDHLSLGANLGSRATHRDAILEPKYSVALDSRLLRVLLEVGTT